MAVEYEGESIERDEQGFPTSPARLSKLSFLAVGFGWLRDVASATADAFDACAGWVVAADRDEREVTSTIRDISQLPTS